MKKLLLFLLIPALAWAAPNGYFQYNQDGTIDMISSGVIVDDVTATDDVIVGDDLTVTGVVTTIDNVIVGADLTVTNDTSVGGTLDVTGKATVDWIEYTATNLYTDLRFPASAVNLPGLANPPDLDIVGDVIPVLSFDNSGNEHIFFGIQMPHEYWPGTTLKPHIHTRSTSAVQTSNWALVYSYADIGEVFSAVQTNTIEVITSGVEGEHESFNIGDMDGLGDIGATDVSSMIGVELKRLSGGSATEVQVMEFDIHYRIKYGSGQPYP